MVKAVKSTDNYNLDSFELHYYYDDKKNKTKRLIYNDNGLLADAYEKGHYELLEVSANHNSKQIEIELNTSNGINYKFNTKQIEIVIYNLKKEPNDVFFNSKEISHHYDESSQSLRINLNWKTSNKSTLNIKY